MLSLVKITDHPIGQRAVKNGYNKNLCNIKSATDSFWHFLCFKLGSVFLEYLEQFESESYIQGQFWKVEIKGFHLAPRLMELYMLFLPYSSFVSQVVIFCSILPPTGGERREPFSASTDLSLASEHFSSTTYTHINCLAPESIRRGIWSSLIYAEPLK